MAKTGTTTLEELRSMKMLEDLSDEELQWFLDHGDVLELDQGELVFVEDEPAEHMFVLLSGAMGYRRRNEGSKILGTLEVGDVGGVLPYSRMVVHTGDGISLQPSRALRIHRDDFPDMLHTSPLLAQRLVGRMSDRVREMARSEQMREKMLALGKLAAGMAHELNNPAAAVSRAVDEMQVRETRRVELTLDLLRHGLTIAQIESAEAVRRQAAARGRPRLSQLERSEREDEIGDWLADHGVDEGWVKAESLTSAGLTLDDLDALAASVRGEVLADLVDWLEAGLAVADYLEQIAASAARISELVQSVKAYSHMDRSVEKQETDVHSGLENTLTMLGHKLKKTAIRVEREYDENLPQIQAHPGDLNQVWTNLIDNAIDAMREVDQGELRLKTCERAGCVYVHVIDNGHGIPEDLETRVFEPFYTTKKVGEGTGLGLDIVERIVRQHEGQIRVATSGPGHTEFVVGLPID